MDVTQALEELNAKINALLPPLYQDCYSDVNPGSMGSATLKYDASGRVAWDDIWTTFCDLALAGGPPHRGTLLESPEEADILASPAEYQAVVQEICRAVFAVTGLAASPSSQLGWISVRCRSVGMAGWLTRAIVVENVIARHDKEFLFLPAGPAFRLAKEIKNVVVALAKTSHYWTDHMPESQQQSIESSLAKKGDTSGLLQPIALAECHANSDEYRASLKGLEDTILRQSNFSVKASPNLGWIGVECDSIPKAIWIVRAMIVEDILSRSEGSVVFLPVCGSRIAEGAAKVANAFVRATDLFRKSLR